MLQCDIIFFACGYALGIDALWSVSWDVKTEQVCGKSLKLLQLLQECNDVMTCVE